MGVTAAHLLRLVALGLTPLQDTYKAQHAVDGACFADLSEMRRALIAYDTR
jgi:hypothetical protein